MGFLKSIFGLIGGIIKTILGVFGVGKKSEFFMELDDSDSDASGPAAPAASAPAPAATAPAEQAPKAEAPAAQPAAKAPAAKAPAAKAPAPKPAQPAAPVPSFAANYLTGPTLPRRRRPGPSLSPFMDMAKQVKSR